MWYICGCAQETTNECKHFRSPLYATITQVFRHGLRLPERIVKPLLSLIALFTNNKDDASRDSLLSLSQLKVFFCSSTIDFFHIYRGGISSGNTKASTIALQGWAFEMPFEQTLFEMITRKYHIYKRQAFTLHPSEMSTSLQCSSGTLVQIHLDLLYSGPSVVQFFLVKICSSLSLDTNTHTLSGRRKDRAEQSGQKWRNHSSLFVCFDIHADKGHSLFPFPFFICMLAVYREAMSVYFFSFLSVPFLFAVCLSEQCRMQMADATQLTLWKLLPRAQQTRSMESRRCSRKFP